MFWKELCEQLSAGAELIVKFKEDIDEYDGPDQNMMAKLTLVAMDQEDPFLLQVAFDLNGYEEHNQAVAQRVWYDEAGEPTLTWFESNFYPEDGRFDCCIDGTLDTEIEMFELVHCEVCNGEEALYWEDENNHVFIVSDGKLRVSVAGYVLTVPINCCPKCGWRFSKENGAS